MELSNKKLQKPKPKPKKKEAKHIRSGFLSHRMKKKMSQNKVKAQHSKC